MPAPTINVGTGPNTGTGDTLRDAFIKVNQVVQYVETSADDAAASAAAAAAAAASGFDAVFNGTLIIADATDKSAAIAAGVAIGKPLMFIGAAIVSNPVTITVPIIDTMAQIFAVGAQVTIDNGLPVRPEWWGAGENTVRSAINALPSGGGTVLLEERIYQKNGWAYGFGSAGSYISKANVKLQGRKMPRLSNDMRRLEGGTIIQGMVLAYADNFQVSDCGIDVGIDVVNAVYGGVTGAGITEALNLTYPDNATKLAVPTKRRAHLHNVIGLCASPSDPTHAVIIGEGYDQVTCTGEVVGAYGVHGVVMKCSSVRAESLVAYCNNAEGVIIKSDAQASAIAFDVQVGRIYSRAQGPVGWSPYLSALGTQAYGVMLHASSNSLDKVQIDQIRSDGAVVGVGTAFGGPHVISSIKIGSIITDQAGVSGSRYGLQVSGGSGQFITRFNIGNMEARNTTVGAQLTFVQSGPLNEHVHIDHLHVVNSVLALEMAQSSYASIGTLTTDTCSDAVYRLTGTPKLAVGMLFKDANTPNVYSTSSGGLVPSLSNGWTQVAGQDPFSVDLTGGRINLRGLVKPGSSAVLCTLPQWAWPYTNKRFLAQGSNGSAQVAVPLVINTAGVVQVNEVAGGTANCSSWLSLSGITYDAQA